MFRLILLSGSGIFCGFFIVCLIKGIILGFDKGNEILVVVLVWVIGLIMEFEVVGFIVKFFLFIVVCCINVCGLKV